MQSSGYFQSLRSVHFADLQFGWAAGGCILSTTDGGQNWQQVLEEKNTYFNSIFFINKKTGWAGGYHSYILKTTDGGKTWNQSFQTFGQVRAIHFVDTRNGWAAADFGVLKTTDGGSHWSSFSTLANLDWPQAIFFVDENTGWIVGQGHKNNILNTTNGGMNWTPQNCGTSKMLFGVHFIDKDTGWIVGANGMIFFTADGGETWEEQASDVGYDLNSVYFLNKNKGWAVGGNVSFTGIITKTTDGGKTWKRENIVTFNPLNSVHFVNQNNGWVVGGGGTILRTSTSGSTWVEENGSPAKTSPNKFRLLQNYPNPFNPCTTFEFHLQSSSKVTLWVFNLLGERLETIIDGQLLNGRVKIQWDASKLPSGIYLYQLRAGDFCSTRKFMKLK